MRPFELIFDHFEVSQKQNNCRNRDKLRWKLAKRLTLELIAAFINLFKMIDLVKDIQEYYKLIFETTFTIL